MSQLTASGAGGSAAPGWYTDPNNPSQLRWWSGEAWTEHVSPANPPAPAQQAQQFEPQQVQPQQAQPQQAQPQQAQPQQVQSPAAAGDALPSRRAMREPVADTDPAAQTGQFQAQQAQYAAQQDLQAQQAAQQAAYQAQLDAQNQAQPAQQGMPPATAVSSQPSPPVPTLPVQPKSFLEQAGYAPLSASPAEPFAASTPVAPAVQQQAQLPPAQPQFPSAAQPGQPLQASAWDQAAQQATEYSNLANSQPGWGAPAASAPAQQPGGIDTLFAQPGQPAAAAPAYEPVDTRHSTEAQQTAGSSTFWGWLIAISPILAAGAIGYVLVSTGYVLGGWPIEAAVAAPYLLVLLFAIADRAALRNLGHEEPRSPGWALLSAPVYLIMRASETRREDGSGTALTLVWFVSVLLAVGGFIGYGYLMHHALIAGLPS